MRNISLKTKILTGILTGGIYLSSVSTTFAVTASPIKIGGKIPLTTECKQINTKTKQDLKSDFEGLVTTRTITKDQANKIKAVINKSANINETKIDCARIITKHEDKIYISSTNNNYTNPLTTLVDNGTITEIQAEKILMKQMYLYHDKMLKSSI